MQSTKTPVAGDISVHQFLGRVKGGGGWSSDNPLHYSYKNYTIIIHPFGD